MVVPPNIPGSEDLPEELVSALADHTTEQARLVRGLLAEYAKRHGLSPDADLNLPAPLLMELAGVITIGIWELQRFTQHLDGSIPDLEDATKILGERCQRGPNAFTDPSDTPIFSAVNRAFGEYFAWEGRKQLGATLIVGPFDEDEIIEALAEFLWTHRHKLTQQADGVPANDQTK